MTELNNVNFQILVQQHGGNVARAKEAWEQICLLGRYGNVPHLYAGGLDVKGLKNALEDVKSGHYEHEVKTFAVGLPRQEPQFSPTLEDDIKQIEDLAAGDKPKGE